MDKAKADFQADWDETMNLKESADTSARDDSRRAHLGYESRSRFYLDKRNGKFLGVCSGIADYTGIGAIWIRLALVMMVLFGFAPVIFGYFIVAFIATSKPHAHYNEEPEQQEFWRNVRTRPHTTVRDVRLRFKEMERRLRDMERHVTSGSRRLDREISALRD